MRTMRRDGLAPAALPRLLSTVVAVLLCAVTTDASRTASRRATTTTTVAFGAPIRFRPRRSKQPVTATTITKIRLSLLSSSSSTARLFARGGSGGGDDNDDDERITLTFRCDETFLSDESTATLPVARNFLRTADPNLLLLMSTGDAASDATTASGGGSDDGVSPVRTRLIRDFDPEERMRIVERWRRRAEPFGAAFPSADGETTTDTEGTNGTTERVCDLYTPAISFPGFRVLSWVRLGVKYAVLPHNDVDNDGDGTKLEEVEYQFVQIDDATEAQGLRPLVWAHDKITGKDRSDPDGGSQRARSFCTIRPIGGVSNGTTKVRFEYKVFLEVQLKFSKIWKYLLPMRSIEKVDAWGSSALTKTVSKNAPQNLNRLHNAFEQRLAEQQAQ